MVHRSPVRPRFANGSLGRGARNWVSNGARRKGAVLVGSALLGIFGALGYSAGCGFSSEGTAVSSGVSCGSVADCEDDNACTEKACTEEKICSVSPKSGGGPDDFNDCTADACNAGVESHAAKPDGTNCNAGAGSGECTMGACVVECTGDAPCDDKNPCTADSCDVSAKTCVHEKIGGLEPGVVEEKGDCKQMLCVAGVPKVVNDPTDVPSPMECRIAACSGGTVTMMNDPTGTSCGEDGKFGCDGKGNCQDCSKDTDCAVTQSCEIAACISGTCVTKNAPKQTVPPDQQTPHDCKLVVCDGNGNPVSQVDDTDVPADDGNSCTIEKCIAGAPIHSPASNGALCDDDNECTTSDICASGLCIGTLKSCDDDNPCTNEIGCDPLTGICKHSDDDGAACDDGDACTNGDACSGGQCAGMEKNCDDANVCTSDGCSAGICTHAPDPNELGLVCGPGSCADVDHSKPAPTCAAAGVCSSSASVVACAPSYDCSAGVCGSCADGVKNGNETDVDCGGGACAGCGFAKGCKANGDCTQGLCAFGFCD